MPSTIVSRVKFIFAWEYGFIRFVYFFLFQKLRSSKEIHEHTGKGGKDYSKKAFYDGKIPVYRPSERTMWPLFFLNSVPLINKKDLLIIGPRYETEILYAKSFNFKNVIGLDTFSYSPLIKTGDMHKMEFKDESFNSIICGWTLTYSDNPALAAKEMIRVMKKNAIVVVGVHQIDENFDISKGINGQNYGPERPDNKKNLDGLFEGLEKIHYIKVNQYVMASYKKIN